MFAAEACEIMAESVGLATLSTEFPFFLNWIGIGLGKFSKMPKPARNQIPTEYL
jgi:hypothetical protein